MKERKRISFMKERKRISFPILQKYTEINNIKYKFLLISEFHFGDIRYELKKRITFLYMVDTNEEILQFEEINFTDDTFPTWSEDYLIPTAKKLMREQRLKELLDKKQTTIL